MSIKSSNERVTKASRIVKYSRFWTRYKIIIIVVLLLIISFLGFSVYQLTQGNLQAITNSSKKIVHGKSKLDRFNEEYINVLNEQQNNVNMNLHSDDLTDLKDSYEVLDQKDKNEVNEKFNQIIEEYKIWDAFSKMFKNNNAKSNIVKDSLKPSDVYEFNSKYKSSITSISYDDEKNLFPSWILKNMKNLTDDADSILNVYQSTNDMFGSSLTKTNQSTLSLDGKVQSEDIQKNIDKLQVLNFKWDNQTKKVKDILNNALDVSRKRESEYSSSLASKKESESIKKASEEASRRIESERQASSNDVDKDPDERKNDVESSESSSVETFDEDPDTDKTFNDDNNQTDSNDSGVHGGQYHN